MVPQNFPMVLCPVGTDPIWNTTPSVVMARSRLDVLPSRRRFPIRSECLHSIGGHLSHSP